MADNEKKVADKGDKKPPFKLKAKAKPEDEKDEEDAEDEKPQIDSKKDSKDKEEKTPVKDDMDDEPADEKDAESEKDEKPTPKKKPMAKRPKPDTKADDVVDKSEPGAEKDADKVEPEKDDTLSADKKPTAKPSKKSAPEKGEEKPSAPEKNLPSSEELKKAYEKKQSEREANSETQTDAEKAKDDKEQRGKNPYIETEPKMKDARMQEAVERTAVVGWGRMNPVTSGHEKLVQKLNKEASAPNHTAMLFLSHSHDKKKNPLTYDQKVSLATKAFGKIVRKSKAKMILDVMKDLTAEGYDNVKLVVGSDRVNEFKTMLNKYNGVELRGGGQYNFNNIEIVSAGERDPDADDVSGMSASKMRAAVAAGEMDKFIGGLPKKLQSQGEKVFKMVQGGMGLNEGVDYLEEKYYMQPDGTWKKNGDGRSKGMTRSELEAEGIPAEKICEAVRGMDDYMQPVHPEMKKVLGRYGKDAVGQAHTDKGIIVRFKNKPSTRDIEGLFKKVGETVSVTADGNDYSIRFYNDDYYESFEYEGGELDERVLDRAQRMKIARAMRKNKVKIQAARKRAMRRKPTKEVYEKRAKKRAIAQVRDKVSGGDKKYADMGPGERKIVDQKVQKRKGLIDRIAKKLIPQMRKEDFDANEVFESYYAGLSKSTADKRKAHFDKYKEYDDDNPAAYKKAPGDATAKTKPSVHTKRFHQMFNSDKDITEAVDEKTVESITLEEAVEGLKKKAEKTGMPYSVLKKVYDRGVAAWRTGHRPGTTPQQWGMARVNSFATKSSGTWGKADKDLAAKVRSESFEVDMNEAFDNFLAETPTKRHHQARNKDGSIKLDKRFRAFRTKVAPKGTGEVHEPEDFLKHLQVAVSGVEEEVNPELMELAKQVVETQKIFRSLDEKAEHYDIDPIIVQHVYQRGLEDYEDITESELTAEQHAMNRVNSFLAGGKAAQLDADLLGGSDESE